MIQKLVLEKVICTYYDIIICAVCRDGDMNLDDLTSTFEGGLSTYRGRVEICVNRTYHSICDIGWDSRDVQVACNYFPGSRFSKFIITLAIRYYDGHTKLQLVRCIPVFHCLRDHVT